jgi:hypothetical protein
LVLSVLVLAVLWVGACPALALDRMGQATAYLGEGQSEIGFDYAWSQTDFDVSGYRVHVYELLEDGWVRYQDYETRSGRITVDTHRAYAHLGYGLGDRVDAFLRLGGAQVDWQDNGGMRLAVSGGLRSTLFEKERWKVGALGQIGWTRACFESVSRDPASIAPAPSTGELSLYEIQIAAAATYRFSDRVAVYGGPFLYFASGQLDVARDVSGLLAIPEIRDISDTYSYDVDETTRLGGYIGAECEISERLGLGIEYQHTADADAVTTGLLWRL